MSYQIETFSQTIQFDRKKHSNQTLLELYEALLLPRLIEEKMLLLLRQGKLSKWFSGLGQEAIAVGCTKALQATDYIFPLHRNLGVFTARDIPLEKLFSQWQGKHSGFTKGRDRSFHFGTTDYRIIGMISHLGAMLGVADGVALASNLDGKDELALVFSGDGGTSEGDFHEAINVAAVWNAPVIFLIEHNGYGLSTPSGEQFRCKQFIDKALGYGIEGVQVNGNNILEVYDATRRIAETMRRERKPVLLEAITFRMRGHEEASGTKYVPKELMEQWAKKDPVENYQRYLLEIGILTDKRIKEQRQHLKALIDDAWERALQEPAPIPSEKDELADVYAATTYEVIPPNEKRESPKRFVNAIAEGLYQAMERDPKLVLMGQDIAEYGGVFKITEGFVPRFGKERVRNTPLCESAIVASALGLSICGRASMVEMQFADFVSCGFNQIVNNLAKTHYRWGQSVNVTVRMPTGAGVGAGPFHSQSNEAWFTHIPGLKVVYPSTPYDAKGLLTTSLIEPNPVLFFEHKFLYRSLEGPVPDEYYNIPLGKAHVVQAGSDVTVVTYGMGVHWIAKLALKRSNIGIEIIDLRTLLPWDKETVFASVKKTGKCLVLHEDTLTGGFGGEIAAAIAEECFSSLDAPVMRVGSMETPVPFHTALEQQFLANNGLKEKLEQLIQY
ncbi:MAG: dehydrogenase E1 component subunit alpha/beta [Ignavibacteriales bacterium]|nr:dehydrogenase E1 component subunit alpha/beta [Ignavibacteriales bacterium]